MSIVMVHRTVQMPLSGRSSLTVSPKTDASFATLYPTHLFWLPCFMWPGPLDHEPQEEAIQAALLAAASQCAELLALIPGYSVTSVPSAKVRPVDSVE